MGENLDKNLEHLEIYICRGFGGGAPDAIEFMEIGVEKSMETGNFWIVLMEILPFFQFFTEFDQIFRENCTKNLGKYGHLHLKGVGGGEAT